MRLYAASPHFTYRAPPSGELEDPALMSSRTVDKRTSMREVEHTLPTSFSLYAVRQTRTVRYVGCATKTARAHDA